MEVHQGHSQVTHQRGAARIAHGFDAGHFIYPKVGGDSHAFGVIHIVAAGSDAHEGFAVAANSFAQLGGEFGQRAGFVAAFEQQVNRAQHTGGNDDVAGAHSLLAFEDPVGGAFVQNFVASAVSAQPVEGANVQDVGFCLHLGAILFGKVKIVFVEGVFGVVPASHHTPAAMNTARPIGAFPVEERIGHRFARLAKENSHRCGREGVLLPQLFGYLVQMPVGGPQFGVGGDAQHAVGGGKVGFQFLFPVAQIFPFGGFVKGATGLDVRAGVDQAAAADAAAVEDHDVVEEVDAHDAKTARCRHPQILENVPVRLWEIRREIPLAPFQDQHPIPLLCQSHGRHAAPKPGTDNDKVENIVSFVCRGVRLIHLTILWSVCGCGREQLLIKRQSLPAQREWRHWHDGDYLAGDVFRTPAGRRSLITQCVILLYKILLCKSPTNPNETPLD